MQFIKSLSNTLPLCKFLLTIFSCQYYFLFLNFILKKTSTTIKFILLFIIEYTRLFSRMNFAENVFNFVIVIDTFWCGAFHFYEIKMFSIKKLVKILLILKLLHLASLIQFIKLNINY